MSQLPSYSTLVFFTLTLWLLVIVQSRPQFGLDEALEEVLNDTFASLIQVKRNVSKAANNRTKTRILFRGDLVGDFGDQDVIFPDSYQVIFDSAPKLSTPPKCAKDATFCEDFESYPYHYVKDLLRKKHLRNDLFGKDEPPGDRYSITNRNGNIESFICAGIQKTIFPRVAMNKNNKWKLIVNQNENEGYIQGIRVEICQKEGSPCDLIGDRLNGYITKCKQKYMFRRMVSLSENGDLIPDTFQLPSACSCSYRKDLSFLSNYEEISARTKNKKT